MLNATVNQLGLWDTRSQKDAGGTEHTGRLSLTAGLCWLCTLGVVDWSGDLGTGEASSGT